MVTYPKLKARYSNGAFQVSRKLKKLPEGASVELTVRFKNGKPRKTRKTRQTRDAQKSFTYPTVALPANALDGLKGILSLGGDALADSEALYDGD
jgi:predicted DNA-binding antitoxin AbrB/MazE fold protein